jgi:hypothetical protein
MGLKGRCSSAIMDFNIIHLMLIATSACFVGCLVGVRVSQFRIAFNKIRTATLLLSMAGYLATLYFVSRDNWYHATLAGIAVSSIAFLPFVSVTAAAILSTSRRMASLALACATLFATVGTGIYYYLYIIDKDEFAGLGVIFGVAIELVTALLLLFAVVMNRRKSDALLHPQYQKPAAG